ncbi:plasmid pRiA4b ORF-3 family protein [Kribbella sp. NPDC023855]|uniref:plasmid pRiA4b ORF-3 family protein n=1 Tax=Kribbella sp. NPDC023855 TaxID=3154698 RepID=UPI00340198B1
MDDSQPLFALPAVRVAPFGELAAAARGCERLQQVRRLAKWTGKRRVTKTGTLLLADARTAGRELGLPEHPEARSATGLPELNELWSSVVGMHLVEGGAGRAEYRAEADDGSDRGVVQLWIDLLATTLLYLPRPDDQLVLPVLMRLHVDTRGTTVDGLVEHALAASLEIGLDGPASTGLPPRVQAAAEPFIRSLVESLTAIDALVIEGELVRLTDLGRFGLVHWFESGGIGAPFVIDLADATVAEVLDLGLTQDSAFDEWFATVGPEIAADRILEYARGGTPTHRVVAFGMLNQVGAVAEERVRACLDDRDLRPHANAWLSARGLPAGESTLDDLHRVFIDMVANDLDGTLESPRDVIGKLANDVEYDAAALFEDLWRCEHPETLPVLQALADYYPEPSAAKAARKGVMRLRSATPAPADSTYQLKAVLRYVKPPVWRRIQVPGSISLAELHEVIQVAMGWSNSHLHEFEINRRRYGVVDDEAPGVLDASGFTLAEVAQAGDRFDYLYDFGDSWNHQVTVEKVLPADSAPTVRCTAGRRNCPPEDIGGPYALEEFLKAYADPGHPDHAQYRNWLGDSYDPAAFNLTEINTALSRLR